MAFLCIRMIQRVAAIVGVLGAFAACGDDESAAPSSSSSGTSAGNGGASTSSSSGNAGGPGASGGGGSTGCDETESCNGVDDDCNGMVDDGDALCPAGEVCTGGRCRGNGAYVADKTFGSPDLDGGAGV